MGKAEYRSAIRSRKLIKSALADLLQVKPLDKITVTDVANRAGINRGTFYAHYRDIPDVIDNLIQETFSKITDALEESTGDVDQLPSILMARIQMIMEEDLDFYDKVMHSGVHQLIQYRLTETLLEYLLDREGAFSNMDHGQFVTMIRFCAGGLGALYHDWFSGKIPMTLDQLSQCAEHMMQGMLP